jgi:uncharacterized cupredoxin-like copper-binding protein
MKKALLVGLALLIASLGLVACGGSDDSSSSSAETQSESTAESGGETGGAEAEGGTAGSASAVDIAAVEGSDLAYDTESASTTAGKVTLNFTNPQAIPHDVDVEDAEGGDVGKTELVAEGSDSVELNLKPGTYTFFCSVPGHRDAGMEGTLTVK